MSHEVSIIRIIKLIYLKLAKLMLTKLNRLIETSVQVNFHLKST